MRCENSKRGGIEKGAIVGIDFDGGPHVGKSLDDFRNQTRVHTAGDNKITVNFFFVLLNYTNCSTRAKLLYTLTPLIC